MNKAIKNAHIRTFMFFAIGSSIMALITIVPFAYFENYIIDMFFPKLTDAFNNGNLEFTVKLILYPVFTLLAGFYGTILKSKEALSESHRYAYTKATIFPFVTCLISVSMFLINGIAFSETFSDGTGKGGIAVSVLLLIITLVFALYVVLCPFIFSKGRKEAEAVFLSLLIVLLITVIALGYRSKAYLGAVQKIGPTEAKDGLWQWKGIIPPALIFCELIALVVFLSLYLSCLHRYLGIAVKSSVKKEKKHKVSLFLGKLSRSEGFKNFIASAVCVLIGLIIGIIVIMIVNFDHSGRAIGNILLGGFNHIKWRSGIGTVIAESIPLLLCSISIIFAYKCGLFNIGAPGQFVVGAMFAFIGAHILKAPWWVCLLLSALGGSLWGMIPGLFKAFLNVNEVITSIMFNWIGLFLVNDVTKRKEMYNISLAECKKIPERSIIPNLGMDKLFDGYKFVTVALFIALAITVIINIVLEKTKFGYEIKATGRNKDAAEYAGMNYKRNTVLTMAIAGALAGIAAGCFYLIGDTIYSPEKQRALPEVGFNGIAVAFLGALNPIGAIFASVLITHITYGGTNLDTTWYSSEIGNLIAALIIYLCAFSFFIKYVIEKIMLPKRKRKKKRKKNHENKVIEESGQS